MARIWAHDHTVWNPGPAEIANRLGWLQVPGVMAGCVDELESFARDMAALGYTRALLLGMGGSSLAPEVFSRTFQAREGFLELTVLDSTDPAAVASIASSIDPGHTLCIVSTKSGTTPETLSFFRYFYNLFADALGTEEAGGHFIAITDAGTPLVDLAQRHAFRRTFLNDPTIGGRYSALSYFGLVPAALIGMDVRLLLDRALILAENCKSNNCPVEGNNNGGRLGTILAVMARSGRDKATFVLSKQLAPFGDWVEQLIAESSGKQGTGIVPIVNEPLGFPGQYGDDRLFVHIRINGDETYDDGLRELEQAGHPVVHICLHDSSDLGGQFFLWEMAMAVAGHILGINPFDQPDVESAKVLARKAISEYQVKGSLPVQTPLLCDRDTFVYGDLRADSLEEALQVFLAGIHDGTYVALQAYLPPTGQTDAALAELRMKIRDSYRVATTLGYGPRFLHSTGQLHKGGADNGLFIQITCDNPLEIPIPDEAGSKASSMDFGVLKTAQALGDWQALVNAGRKVLRLHVGLDDVSSAVRRIAKVLG